MSDKEVKSILEKAAHSLCLPLFFFLPLSLSLILPLSLSVSLSLSLPLSFSICLSLSLCLFHTVSLSPFLSPSLTLCLCLSLSLPTSLCLSLPLSVLLSLSLSPSLYPSLTMSVSPLTPAGSVEWQPWQRWTECDLPQTRFRTRTRTCRVVGNSTPECPRVAPTCSGLDRESKRCPCGMAIVLICLTVLMVDIDA